jgi:hypothetical protein
MYVRLRLSDAAAFAVLAEHYGAQAGLCCQMAHMTLTPVKEGWLELAAEWMKLMREISQELRRESVDDMRQRNEA